ncbi:MAG TPA: M1 family aminopeptidase [Jatrophihabitans sp.]|nr:M1 family aminopeptidase [Jatrophihabitans sp.]
MAAGAVLLAGCTSATTGRGTAGLASRPPTTSPAVPGSSAPPSSSTGSSPASPARGCATYAAPDPNRPRMTLRFTIAGDHKTVDGTERIAFRPDKPITELVFRLTANTRPTVAEGNRIEVRSASADSGGGRFRFTAANAAPSTQGGLLHIPFARPVPAGTTVTANLSFRLTLGADSFDRFGTAGDYAYFGSAEPLLSWQRGYGWHTEDLIDFPAESATSEAMDVDLTVVAPARDTVIMSGDPADPPRSGGATRTWHSHVATARDVSVAAGPFSVADTVVDGVKLRLGAPSTSIRDELVPEFRRAITELSRRFGPFPFPSLSVARLPASGGGIEYPSSILMLDGSRLVAVHETAHQWFYAMVGDSQAQHPWLDEAFAQYAEELTDGSRASSNGALNAAGPVDASTESYGDDMNDYYFTTYDKGAAALFAARDAADPAKWDAALRCYAARNAWRIAEPSDLEAALRQLPAAVRVLQHAGALH